MNTKKKLTLPKKYLNQLVLVLERANQHTKLFITSKLRGLATQSIF
jgi:hypothetical protein